MDATHKIETPMGDLPGAAARMPDNSTASAAGPSEEELTAAAEYVSRKLYPQHQAKLRACALSDLTIKNYSLFSTRDHEFIKRELRRETLSPDCGDFLSIPYDDNYHRFRPDKPHPAKDPAKPGMKYMSPVGLPPRLYWTETARRAKDDASIDLHFTEGEIKALCGEQHLGLAIIALPGVSMWSAKREKDKDGKPNGERSLSPEILGINLKNRKVYIDFDSDAATKKEVGWEMEAFAAACREAGATVFIVVIPPGPKGEKYGLDDYIHAFGADAFRHCIVKAKPAKATKKEKLKEAKDKSGGKPVIVVDHHEDRVNDEAVAALGTEPDLYQRGGLISRIALDGMDTDPRQVRTVTPSITASAIKGATLRERLARCARFMEFVKGKNGEPELVPAHPPDWCVNAVLARGRWPSLRPLDAMLTYPAMLPDGTVPEKLGYNADWRIYVRWPCTLIVDVPQLPTRSDVDKAVALLLDLVCDFPFESPAHRSAWLAGLLTPLAYQMFDGPVPLFLIDGNCRGVGKGKLANLIALIVMGGHFSPMPYTDDQDEFRKIVTTLAVEGATLVLMDNLNGSIGHAVLDLVLTTTRWKSRILGLNQSYDGPIGFIPFATGNNITLKADTSRRTCHIRLETPEETPERKSAFKYPNLEEYASANRDKLLTAALTILRGWAAAGRPQTNLPAWGSYEGWSSVVRQCVVWAGLPDPGDTREALQQEADRDATCMKVIIIGLQQLDPECEGLTVSQIVQAITPPKPSMYEPPLKAWAVAMGEAIAEQCGRVDTRKVGNLLRRFKRRNFGGVIIDGNANNKDKVNKWFLRDAKTLNRMAGSSPHNSPDPATTPLENFDETPSNQQSAGSAGSAGSNSEPRTHARGRFGDAFPTAPSGDGPPASPADPAGDDDVAYFGGGRNGGAA